MYQLEHVLNLALATGAHDTTFQVHSLRLACTLQGCIHPWLLHHPRTHAAACWQLQGSPQPAKPATCYYGQVVSDLHVYPPSRGGSFSRQLKLKAVVARRIPLLCR